MNLRTTAAAAAALNLLTILASVVVNKVTSFSDWRWIVVGSAVLTVMTASICALAWRIERNRAVRNRTTVKISAKDRSSITGSAVSAQGGAGIELSASTASKLRRNKVKAAAAQVDLRAADRSRISDQHIDADS
ncbi:hypothetical protein [Nocardia sp. NPDC052566]|uniref:hypothetical protein n=1 Tax=Nocardia sp. NPDC052566 TaxID=3364330 RepID=UPI0037CB05BD